MRRIVALLVSILLPLIAAAETIDEIVVTADFRERSLAELPASVSVLDAEAIEAGAVQHFEELIRLVPNINWSGDGHRPRYLQIRGVGELEQYEGAPNPSVGFLVDDIDFSGIGTIATLFDIERVEVLRGPQGTRYGANALAGLVYLRSALPSEDWRGRVQVTAGEDDARSLGAAIGGPLDGAGALTFRASAHRHESDGFRENPYLGRDDTNGRDETTIRTRLAWLPAADWSVDLATMFVDVDDGYDAFALDNGYTMLSDKPGRDAQQSVGASARVEWAGRDDLAFTSITAWADSDIVFSFDADWGNPDSWAPYTYDYFSLSLRDRRTLSQEFRLAGDRWLAGIYALDMTDALTTRNQGEYYDPFFDFSDSLDASFASDYEATSLALFGQADFELASATRLTAGLRVERRTTDYRDTAGLAADPAETMAGGELTLNHAFGDELSGYLSLAKGYKAGGFNLGPVPEGRREFGAEDLWSLEAGIRASLLEDRLGLSAAVFYNRRLDQQVRTSFQTDPGDPTTFVFFTDNAARGETLGFEAELAFTPGERWEFFAALGLLDATFDEFETPEVDLDGRRQAHAPGYTVTAGATYAHPRGFFARVDVSAKDEFYFDVSHDQRSWSYELVNARLGYGQDAWRVELWARNLFDEKYPVRGFYFGNEPPDFPNELYVRLGDPRQLGVTLDWRF
ncbi:MAG: TonB-dependent receptor [Woeseiaceae bacterium]|nr:TonB-dependent receptor [Woeseiaceae bacterium]